MPFKYSKNLKVEFPLSNQIQIKFYFVKKNQIKSNQISWIMICASNFFQIICFNKNKTNQIKSNLWDNVFYFKYFFKFLATTKINQIKSNQISWIMICISNFFQIFVSLL